MPEVPPTWLSQLQPIFTGILTLLGAWLGVGQALKRFKGERWWTRREEAYSNVIEAQHKYLEALDVGVAEGEKLLRLGEAAEAGAKKGIDSHPVPYDLDASLAKMKTAEQEIERAQIELRRIQNVGTYLLSSKAVALLTKKPMFVEETPGTMEETLAAHRTLADSQRKRLQEFTRQAKKDLGVR